MQIKCVQYWPKELHSSIRPGKSFSVTYTSTLPFAEYEIRKFKLQNVSVNFNKNNSSFSLWRFSTQLMEDDSRVVTQLHYTAWPDHGVPENVMSLIGFIRRVRKHHPASLDQPLLVHCSAGVGRTGTFVLLDMMMQQMKAVGTLSVHQCLRKLRAQRMNMVQTKVYKLYCRDYDV